MGNGGDRISFTITDDSPRESHVAAIGTLSRGDNGIVAVDIVIDAVLLKVIGYARDREQE